METLRQDIAYALRQMRQSPVFTLTAMLTLALGIGATTAIFSLIHTVMLKSLPVVDPASLYRIGTGDDCCGKGCPQEEWGMFSYSFYLRMTQNTPEFAELAAFQAGGSQFSARQGENDRIAKPIRGEYITGNYFSTFGIKGVRGAHIDQSDDQPTATPVAMLSYRAWQQEYGSDPKVVGSSLTRWTSVHDCGHHAAGILRRDAAQRSAGAVDSTAAGADVAREELAIAHLPCVAARDRPVEAGRDAGRDGLAVYEPAARVAGGERNGGRVAISGSRLKLPKQNIKVIPAGRASPR